MDAGFYFDDEPNIVWNAALHWNELSFHNVQRTLTGATLSTRPVANLSFAVNHLIGGLDPVGYHWANLLVHLATGCALGWVCWLLAMPYCARRADRDWAVIVSVTVAGVFLLHPANTQAVTYVVQRMTSMATLFGLIAFGLYVKARTGGKHRRLLASGSAVAWLVALGCKEIAACLPFVVALYEVSFHRQAWRSRLAWLASRRGIVPIAGFVAVLAWLAWTVASTRYVSWNDDFPGRNFNGWERLLTQARVQFLYLSLLLWPAATRLTIDHEIAVSTSLMSPWTTLPAVLGVFAFCAAVVWLVIRHPRYGFPLGAYLLAHSLESGPIGLELVFEHRLYLPMAFLLLALATLLSCQPRARRRGALIVVLLSCVPLSIATHERNVVWADPIAFLTYTAQKAPGKSRPWYNLGTLLGPSGDLAGAERAFRHALSIEPDRSETHNQLANVCRLTGRTREALEHYRAAVELDPDNAEPYYNLATLLQDTGDPSAVHYYRVFVNIATPDLAGAKRDAEIQLRILAP
jgi:hypothetical protein